MWSDFQSDAPRFVTPTSPSEHTNAAPGESLPPSGEKKKSHFMANTGAYSGIFRGRWGSLSGFEANTNSFSVAEDKPQLNILITPLWSASLL